MTDRLAVRDDITLAELQNPHVTAAMIRLAGLQQNVDDLPDLRDDETAIEYIERVWPRLQTHQRAEAVTAGLQLATWHRNALDDGIQLVVWQAYSEGWVVFDTESEFRAWVRDVVAGEDRSPTEASLLASTVLNLAWLDANNFDLGREVEEIFADRALYNRWRRMAGKLRNAVEVAEEEAPGGEADDRIHEIIEAVNDDGKTTDDLDQVGRQRLPLLPITVIEKPGRDDLGRVTVEAQLTPAQRTLLQQRMGSALDYRLEGEVYGVKTHRLVEYRQHKSAWSRRTYNDGWGPWEPLDGEPDLAGKPREGIPIVDDELDLRYMWVWERNER